MSIFYKYISYVDEKTFTDPTVRLSVPMHLNDPFESAVCNDIANELREAHLSNNERDLSLGIFSFVIRDRINQYGIVSLSETSRNLLMWAHYANEHRGICIGYKDDFLSSKENNLNTDHGGHFKPTKVMYDRIRFYKEDEVSFNQLSPSEQCFKILTNKSDEWINEKEHRCIVPLIWADFIRFKNELPTLLQQSLDISLELGVKVDIKNNEDYYINDLQDYGLRHSFSQLKDSIYLKIIDPSKIDRIYFGCRYPKQCMDNIVKDISNKNHVLHHVKLYKYELDPVRFELNEVPLRP